MPKCQNRSRLTPVQRKRSAWGQPVKRKAKTTTPEPYLHLSFAYKTYVFFFMVLKWQRPRDIDNACIAEMPKSLSPYACAAKSLFSAATNAKILIDVNKTFI